MAIRFNGTSDVVEYDWFDVPGDNRRALTIMGWVFLTKINPTAEMPIDTKTEGTGVQNTNFGLYIGTSREVEFRIKTGNNKNKNTTQLKGNANSIPINEWCHIAGIYDGNRMAVYVNGVEENSVSKTGDIFRGYMPHYIGGQTSSRFFGGFLDDQRVYFRSLPTTEITTIFNSKGNDAIFDSLYTWWQWRERSPKETVYNFEPQDSGITKKTGWLSGLPIHVGGIIRYGRTF